MKVEARVHVCLQREMLANAVAHGVHVGEHSKDITDVLQTQVRDGLLTRRNQRRCGSCHGAEGSPQSDVDSPHLAGDSPQSAPQWVEDSPQLQPNSPQLDRLAGLPAAIRLLLPLAEPARKNRKLPAGQLRGWFSYAKGEGWLVGYVTSRRLPIPAILCGLPLASLPSMCGRPGSEHWRRAGFALWAGIGSL